jgi:hypothetical protein
MISGFGCEGAARNQRPSLGIRPNGDSRERHPADPSCQDEDNYASSDVLPNGSWRLRVRDNGSNGTRTEQNPVTFV